MLDVALHTGSEHPDLWLIAVPTLLAFLAGIGINLFGDRIRSTLGLGDESAE
ncbi:hypothetical protein [Halopenitus persicus]|jgi:ABC-type dipeptide/oligopeptide/nickel transport system permease subunit|uniref:Peptide/nickel transport system permease protein n=1 Tax=Halopenitus persicus TaxID=1048396 RepID=A0A1H3DJ54_9EURY|nr:hypothetical protein [Halopenitus persicus]SDX66421.1 hypothetical protein SAMN05216564_10129 [Halopenitus persicus]